MLDIKSSIFVALLFSLSISTVNSAAAAPKAAAPKATPKKEAAPAQGDALQGKHLFKHYCAVCHGVSGKGNGVNAENLDPHPSDLTSSEVASLSDQEIYLAIEKGGAAVELSAGMPPWGKTLSKEQIDSIITYIRTSLQKKGSPEGEKEVRFSDVKRGSGESCRVCHIKRGEAKVIAPNLGHEGTKLNREWLGRFLKDPGRVRPVGYIPLTKSKMPNFQFSNEEVSALVAFLMTKKDPGISPAGLAGFKAADPEEIEKGKKLFTDKFACDACHRTGGKEGGVVGPDLAAAAQRLRPEWMFYWIRNPQVIRPDAPMPNFGASDAEIRSLIAYIISVGQGGAAAASNVSPPEPSDSLVKSGEKIVKEKNCLSCHTLDTYNSQIKRSSPEALSTPVTLQKGG